MSKIVYEMDINKYHEDKTVLSSTGVKEGLKSSRSFAHYLMSKEDRNQTFDFGNAFEVALVDKIMGTNYLDKVAVFQPTNEWEMKVLKENPKIKAPTLTKLYKHLVTDFERKNEGKYIIRDIGDSESKEQISQMVESVLAYDNIVKMIKKCEYQVSFFWEDGNTGAKCKTRPDLISKDKNGMIIDIKTARDASPHAFARQAAQLDYPVQACMQIAGALKSGYLEEVEQYLWLVVEKTAPFHVALYRFQPQDVEFCFDRYAFGIKKCFEVLEKMRTLGFCTLNDFASYGEMADNKEEILDLNLPLYYGR